MGLSAETIWRRQARRAAAVRVGAAVLRLGLPAAWGIWMLGGLAARAGYLPAALVGVLGWLALALAPLPLWLRTRGRWRALPVDRALARALDWRAGAGGGPREVDEVWRRATWGGRDPWWTALAAAVAFVAVLNSSPLWWPTWTAMLGRPTGWTIDDDATLVRFVGLTVRSEVAGDRRHDRSDGFLRVDEGDRIRWEVETTRPATAVAIWRDDHLVDLRTLDEAGRTAFELTAESAFGYRFSIWRWGVERRERLLRRVDVRPDRAPELRWEERPAAKPPAGAWIRFAWRARDDRGVTDVVLEAVGDGETMRIPLADFSPPVTDGGPTTARIDPAELPQAAQVMLTLVARDNDRFDGPNVGRSEALTIELETPEAQHEAWLSSLAAFLREGVRVLGDGLEAVGPEASHHAFAAGGGLARRAEELAEDAARLPMRGADAEERLAAIAADWRRAAAAPPPLAARAAEDAVYETDRLIGREEAARLEWEQEQLVGRVEDLADELDTMGDAELDRLMKLIEREMRDVAEAMRTRRPQLPSELMQEEALQPESQRDRQDRMQAAREALARGDRDEARRQLEALLDELREAREGMRNAAGGEAAQAAEAAKGARSEARQLDEMAKEQEALGEAQQVWEGRRRALDQATRALGEEAFGGEGARSRELSRAMREGDGEAVGRMLGDMRPGQRGEARRLAEGWRRNEEDRRGLAGRQQDLRERTQALREAGPEEGGARRARVLEKAEEKQAGAERALGEGSGGEAAMQAWQAADALREAAELAREREEQSQAMAGAPSFLAPQGKRPGPRDEDGDSDDRPRGDEPFSAPDAGESPGSRADILRGFREGIPDPGRDVGERYLDRLLH